MRSRHSLPVRIFATALLAAFSVQDFAWAAPRVPWLSAEPVSHKALVRFDLPPAAAFVEDVFKAPSREGSKTLILVQDAHTNASGQIHIAEALDVMLRSEGIRTVFLEAGSGDASLSYLRGRAPLEHRKAVALSYLHKGLLQGSEYLDVTSDLDFKLWGVEDASLYVRAIDAYRALARDRDAFTDYLARIESTLEFLESRLFGPGLAEFSAVRRKFLAGETPLTAYFAALTEAASREGVSLGRFRNLRELHRVRRLERKIDFAKAAAEQEKAYRGLPEADRAELDLLSQKVRTPSLLVHEGGRERSAFYALLEERIAGKPGYGELRQYFRYLKMAQALDARGVLEEFGALEAEVLASLAKTYDEAKLLEIGESCRILRGLLDFTLTPRDFEAYRAAPGRFRAAAIAGFLNRKLMDLGAHFEKALFIERGFEEALEHAGEFYELTYRRDAAFVSNALEVLGREGQEKAVLITGGYHTPNLKAMLQSRGVSYVSVTPQVLYPTDRARYEKLLLSQDLGTAREVRVAAGGRAGAASESPAASLLPIHFQPGRLAAFEADMTVPGYAPAPAAPGGSRTSRPTVLFSLPGIDLPEADRLLLFLALSQPGAPAGPSGTFTFEDLVGRIDADFIQHMMRRRFLWNHPRSEINGDHVAVWLAEAVGAGYLTRPGDAAYALTDAGRERLAELERSILTWNDEAEVLALFRKLMTELDWPWGDGPRAGFEGVKPKPLTVEGLQKLAGRRRPAQYYAALRAAAQDPASKPGTYGRYVVPFFTAFTEGPAEPRVAAPVEGFDFVSHHRLDGDIDVYLVDPKHFGVLSRLFGLEAPDPSDRYLLLAANTVPFAVARENPGRQMLWTMPVRPEALSSEAMVETYYRSLLQYLHRRLHARHPANAANVGRLVEWIDADGQAQARFLKGNPAGYRKEAGDHAYRFFQDFQSGDIRGRRYLLGTDQLFRLQYGAHGALLTPVIVTEKRFRDPQSGLLASSYLVLPERVSAHLGLGLINAQIAHYARNLGFTAVAANRSPDRARPAARDGLDLYLLDEEHAGAYAGHPDLVLSGSVLELLQGVKPADIIVEGFDGEVDHPDFGTISVSELMRRTLLSEASARGIPVFYQGGSDATVQDGFINPFLLDVLAIPFAAAHPDQTENQCFSCNGTSSLSLIAPLGNLGEGLVSSEVDIKFIRRGVDFPRVKFAAGGSTAPSKPVLHHTYHDILEYIERLKRTLPADLKGRVDFKFAVSDEDGEPAFKTYQSAGPNNYYHKVIANVRVLKSDGTFLTPDEFKRMIQKAPNVAVVHHRDFFEFDKKDGHTVAVDLKEKAVNELTTYLVDELGVDRPAITPVVAAEYPGGDGFAIGALTFQKHNVVPANLSLMLVRLGLVGEVAEANRRAMEIMGMDVLKRELETGRFGDPELKPGLAPRGARAPTDEEFLRLAEYLRFKDWQIIKNAGSGHPGGSLSAIEVFAALYSDPRLLRIDPARDADPDVRRRWQNRDRFVLSKAHVVPGQYPALYLAGLLGRAEIENLRKDPDGFAQGHATMTTPGIDLSGGVLGYGAPAATGMAIAAAMDGRDYHTFALIGDGEAAKGPMDEMRKSFPKLGLDNFTAILDFNQYQQTERSDHFALTYDETVEDWRNAGWNVVAIDGEDFKDNARYSQELRQALLDSKTRKNGKPTMLVIKTIKGRGITLAEDAFRKGDTRFHGSAPKPAEYDAGVREIAGRLGISADPARSLAEIEADLEVVGDALRAKFRQWRLTPQEIAEIDRLNGIASADARAKRLQTKTALPPQKTYKPGDKVPTRAAMGDALLLKAATDSDIVFVSPSDLKNSVHFEQIGKTFGAFGPQSRQGRLVDLGIVEDYGAAVAIGLSAAGLGFKVVAASFDRFLSIMASQIEFATLNRIAVGWVGTHAGAETGEDGGGNFSIMTPALMSALSNFGRGMEMREPSDAVGTDLAVDTMLLNLQAGRSGYLRVSRNARLVRDRAAAVFNGEAGGAGYVVWKEPAAGRQPEIVLAGSGATVTHVIEAAGLLEAKGIPVRVIEITSLSDTADKSLTQTDLSRWLAPGVPVYAVYDGAQAVLYDGLTHAAQSTKAFVPVHTRGITNAGSAPSQRMMEANRFTAPFIAEDAEAILKHSADPGQPLPNGVFTRAGARVAFKNLGGIRGRDWWNGMEPARQELLRRFLGTKGTEPVNTIPFDHHKPKDHYGHAELTAEENMLLIANSMASYVDKYLIHPGYLLGRYVLEEKGAKTRRFMPLRDIAKLAPDEKEKMKFSRVSLHPKLPKDKLYVLKWEGEKTPNGDGENAIGKRPTNQGEELGITAADVAAVPQVVGLKFMTYVDSSNPAAFDPIVREVIVQSQVAHGAGLLFFPEDLPAKTAAGKSFEDAFDSEPDPAKEGKRRLTDEGKRQKAEWEAKNPLLFAEALDRLGVDYDAYKFTFPGDLKRMSLAAIRENLRRMARYTYGRFVMMLSGGDAATLVDKARMSSEELNFVGNFAGRGVWQKSFTSVPSPLAADPNAVVTPVQKKAIAAQIAQNLKEGDARHQWDALNTVKPRMPWWEYLGLTKAEAGIPEGSRAPKVAALDRMDLAQIRVPDLVVQDLSGRKSEQEIIDADPAIVLVRSSTQVTRDLIDRLPNLKAIIRLGHGLDNVDVAYARHKKIHVVGTKGSKRSVAALALRMTLIALQGDETAPADAAPAELLSLGSFEKALEFKLKGKPDAEDLRKAAAAILRPISARTLDQARWLKIGIIGGTGDIGSEAAALARSLGMDVLVNSRSLEENEGLRSKLKAGRFATQNEIYGTAHVVVLLTGLSDTTRGMVGREAVDAMIGNRELIALVNPDREDLVVESELVRLVDAGKKYLVDELPKLPALKAKSFYLPHIGGSTPEAEAGVFEATNRELASAAAALAGSRATVGFGRAEGLLTDREIRGVVRAAAAGENDFKDRRVLVITPDLTRSAAAKGLVGKVFGELYDAIGDEAEKVDILVAQGTHHALSAAQKAQLLGVTPRQLKHGRYKKVTIHDHRWNDPASLKTLGTLPAAFIRSATQGLFEADVPVTVNALVDRSRYDDVVVIGPVYPHEVVGISGGNKYFFPGVGGEELLNFFHWLGAVITNVRVIGNKETPVRAVVDEAAKLIDRTGVRRHAFTIVDRPEGIAGLWFGAPEAAWSEAADLAGAVHTATLDRPYRRVIAVLPEGLDELWVGGKGFYKAENVVADGGELVIYAPHITTLHPDFGPDIERIGYHSADYFLKQWDKFKNEKGAVLAHLTHVYGQGAYDPATGADKGRVKVTLATGIPPALAAKINLGYAEPDGIAAEIAPHLGGINPDHYVVAGDTLIIKPAGEKLFRLKPGITTAAGPAKGSRVQGQQGQAVTRGRFAGTALKVVVTKETDDEPATAGERVLARVDISRVGRHHEIYHTVTREAPLGLSARDAAFAIAAGIDEKARLGVHTGTVGKAELEAAVTATPLELSAGRETRPLAQGDTAPAAPGGPKAGARTGSVLVNFRVFVAGVIAVFAGRIAAAAAPVELPVALEAQRTAVVRLSAAEGRPGEAVFRVEPDAAIAPSYDLGLNDAKSAYRAALEAAAADAGSAAADSLLAARRALAAMEDEARQTQAGLPRELLLRPVPADFRVDLASYAALSADEAERQVRFLGLEALRFGRSAAGQDVRFVWQNAGSADSRARKAAEDMALLSRGRIVDEKDAASPEGRLQVRFLDPRAAVRSDGSVHIPWTGARAGEAPNWRVIFLLGKASAAVAAPHARRGAVDFEKLRSSDVPTALLDAWGSRAAARPTEAEFLGTVSGASPDLFVRFVLRPVQKIIDETLETLDAILKLIRSMA